MKMNAVALKKDQELLDEIIWHRDGLRKLNIFEKRKLIQKARDLRGKITDFHLDNFFGMISCLAGDSDSAVKYHEVALKKAPDDFTNQGNYFASLNAVGLIKKSFEFGKCFLNKYPDNLEILATLVNNALFLGRLQDAFNLLDRFEEPERHEYYDVITKALPVFKQASLNDDEAEKILNCAFDFLCEKKLYLSKIQANISEDMLIIRLYVDMPVSEMFDINWNSAEFLANAVSDMRCDVVMFEFNTVQILLDEQAFLEKQRRKV